MNNRKLQFILIFIGLLLVVWWIFHSESISFKFLTPAYIKEKIGAFGNWAFVVYIAVYIANTILIFPPNAPISLSAGLLFGPLWGFVTIMVSIALSTSVAFWIARSLGRKFVDKYIKGRWEDIAQKLAKKGFVTVFCLRLVPVIQYEILNYICGISTIKFRDFFLGTILGMIPGAIVIAFLGGKLAEVESIQDLFSFKIMIAGAVLFLFIGIPTIYFLFFKKDKSDGQ